MKIKLAGQGQFYTITNLQGSQTDQPYGYPDLSFYTITNLQGSQTRCVLYTLFAMFYTITNLQGSQTSAFCGGSQPGFTPLQTYKVLKHVTFFII